MVLTTLLTLGAAVRVLRFSLYVVFAREEETVRSKVNLSSLLLFI